MFLIEAIITIAILMAVLSLGIALLKFVFAVVIIPLKITFFLAKGLLGLLVILPMLVLAGVLLSAALPVVLLLLLIPVFVLGSFAFRIVSV